jgi:zinc D-Ala-D-Ala carboxypeptidase
MKISEHFTLEELTYSETAIRKSLDNIPSDLVIANLKALCENVLEPLRTILGVPIKINSGYRSIAVNQLVGGVVTSQHCLGQAADTVAIGLSIKDYYDTIKKLVRNNQIILDQCIFEYRSWVHISFSKGKSNRNEFLIKNVGTGYIHDNT